MNREQHNYTRIIRGTIIISAEKRQRNGQKDITVAKLRKVLNERRAVGINRSSGVSGFRRSHSVRR